MEVIQRLIGAWNDPWLGPPRGGSRFNGSRGVVKSRDFVRAVRQRSGVIIFVTGSPARGHGHQGATAIGAAFGAIETLMENLAVEVGLAGVRAVCVRTTANTDSRSIQETIAIVASKLNLSKEEMPARMAGLNFLKVPATVSDTATAAVFVASDPARMMTGTVVNSTAGAAAD